MKINRDKDHMKGKRKRKEYFKQIEKAPDPLIVRVKRSEFDQWMQTQRPTDAAWMDQVVEEILS